MHLSRKFGCSHFFLSLFFLFFMSFAIEGVVAQSLSYPVVHKDGAMYYQYIVGSGEGLYALSKKFSISQEDILTSNPALAQGVKNGQKIFIPVKKEINVSKNEQQSEQKFSHTVLRGETLYSLSITYNVSVEDIYKLNPEARNGLKIGMNLIIPQKLKDEELPSKKESFLYHTITPKETLYSLSKTYSVTAKVILDANPGLSDKTFQIGRVVRIPVSTLTDDGELQHNVKSQETIYSISRKYGVSESSLIANNPSLAQGLRAGMLLYIPKMIEKSESTNEKKIERDVNKMIFDKFVEKNNLDVIRVGLLLPFLDKTDNRDIRCKEYYEGFLLAVEDLKKRGANIELYVFDIGAGANVRKLKSLLETMEMQSLNLIVGGVSKEQVKMLSNFATAHSIKYVIPFTSRIDEVLLNDNIFQVNTPHSYLYSKASTVVLNNIDKKSNIVFVSNGGKQTEKESFVSQLKKDLNNEGLLSVNVVSDNDFDTKLLEVLDVEHENVIFPETDDVRLLRNVFKALKKIEDEHPYLNVTIVGHPSWQTFASHYLSDFFRFNVMFYSPFFVDKSPYTIGLNNRYSYWYDKDMYKTFPRYGTFAYDTGLFFLTALFDHGSNFEKNIDKVSVNTVQSVFRFERINNWSGFINTGMFLIKYNPNSTISKIDFSR